MLGTMENRLKLHGLKNGLRYSLAFMWLISALTSILPATLSSSYTLLSKIGLVLGWQSFFLYSAVGLNVLIGLSLLFAFKIKINCYIQLITIITYTLIITLTLPNLWLDPFGAVVKNIPILFSVYLLLSWEKYDLSLA